MTITLDIGPVLEARYRRLADETGRPESYYLNQALECSIDRLEYEYAVLKDVEDYRAGRLKTYSLDEVRRRCGLGD